MPAGWHPLPVGAGVDVTDGAALGDALNDRLGDALGAADGAVGDALGVAIGDALGNVLGDTDGAAVVGAALGTAWELLGGNLKVGEPFYVRASAVDRTLRHRDSTRSGPISDAGVANGASYVALL